MSISKYFLLYLLILPLLLYSQNNIDRGGTEPLFSGQKVWSRNTKAVIIGISDYKHIDDLNYADDDAKSISEYLINNNLLDSSDITLLLDAAATRVKVRDAIYDALSEANSGDQVIIYFAGHGDANQPHSLSKKGYLLCYGVNKFTEYEKDDALGIDRLRGYIADAIDKEVFVVLILDACRAGFFFENRRNTTVAATLAQLSADWHNTVKLISCEPDQSSQEGKKWGGGHGVFTYYLLEALRMATKDLGKPATVYELFKHIDNNTVSDTQLKQIPVKRGSSNHILFLPKQKNLVELTNEQKMKVSSFSKKNTSYTFQNDTSTSVSDLIYELKKAIEEGDYTNESGKNAKKIYLKLKEKAPEEILKEIRQELYEKLNIKVSKVLDIIINGDYQSIPSEALQEAIEIANWMQTELEVIPDEREEWEINKKLFEGYKILAENNEEQFSDALKFFTEIKEKRPEGAYIHNSIGLLYKLQGNLDSAIYYFTKSKELAVNWSKPVEGLISAYLDNGNTILASSEYNYYLEKYSSSSNIINEKLKTIINQNRTALISNVESNNINRLSDLELKIFKEEIKKKLYQFQNYLSKIEIFRKAGNNHAARKYINVIMQLFLNEGEGITVEIFSTRDSNKRISLERLPDYLERIALENPAKFTIKEVDAVLLSDFLFFPDENEYQATASIFQEFIGGKENNTIYLDTTIKTSNVRIPLSRSVIRQATREQQGFDWIPLLGDIKIVESF